MEEHWIFEKTAAGIAEVAGRKPGLSRQARAVLIMVDGRTTAAALLQTAAALGEPHQALRSLLEAGLIQRRGQPAGGAGMHGQPPGRRPGANAAMSGPTARPAPRPAERRSLALARLFLMNAMEQALRHNDHPVRERLRRASSRAELLDAFAHCMNIAGEIGVAHVTTLEDRFMALLPEDEYAGGRGHG